MKTIIAGSRSALDYRDVVRAVRDAETYRGIRITEVVSGGARGPDKNGELYAERNGIALMRFPPDWAKLGKRAGMVRNHEMGNYADALIAVFDGESPGTTDMIKYARKRGLLVYVHRYLYK